MKYYAGIGSRETPPRELARMEKIGKLLGELGYTLRSGGAKGADQAFETGARSINAPIETWNPSQSYFPLHEWATDKASDVCWEFPLEKMKAYTISLITRNMYQVFGDEEDALKPVDFVVYWCPSDPLIKGRESGGTRYAVRAAHEAGIPTYNLRTQVEEFASFLKGLKENP